ncbi:MAG: hypothetical protein ABXS91_09465 [Sulfurimonas sp.]
MKNLLDNMAVGLVVLLSLGVIGLVVQYNIISDDGDTTTYDEEVLQSLQSESTKPENKSSYLDSLEGYEDVDVKVDPRTEESGVNIAVVKVETNKEGIAESIGTAVENVEKKENYLSTLEGYEERDVNVDSDNETSELNIVNEEDGKDAQNVVEPIQEGQPNVDPLSDIVSDIDSIVDASE